MKKMGMGTAETVNAIHTKSVVPYHPTTTVKAHALRENLKFGSVLIANGQPECPVWL
jgi:hypothetical protein